MLSNVKGVTLEVTVSSKENKMNNLINAFFISCFPPWITNTASGMGLIKCGSVVIPFDNQISKDTDLYKLYNTNIHELIEEKKKREAGK